MPILYITLAIVCFGICLQVAVSRRPVFVSQWWRTLLVTVALTIAFVFPTDRASTSGGGIRFLVCFAVVVALVVTSWMIPKGYDIIGVTARAFRGALYASLEKMDLTFDEKVPPYSIIGYTGLKLTPGDIELLVFVRLWGIGYLRIPNHRDAWLLHGIVDGMKQYFEKRTLGINGVAILLVFVIGALLLALGVAIID